MVDIARDARWGRIQEGAGEDPYLGAAMAAAQVRGFQGATLGPNSIVACVKHYAGYGAAEGGRDYDGSYVPEALMRNVYLVPFHAAVQAGVGSLMSAYMDLNDVPASGNRWLLTDVLRRDWGFRGFVASDAFAVASLQAHGYASDPADATYKAISAGAGMDMASQTFRRHLAQLVTSGKISAAQIDAAVLPILEVKLQIGLFDHPYADTSGGAADVTAEGRSLARRLASRSMVLLKNDNHVLPLANTVRNVAVIGSLADSPGDITGGPTPAGVFGQGKDAPAVTVLAALKDRLGSAAQVAQLSAMNIAGYINEHAATTQVLPALAPHLFPDSFNRRASPRIALGVPVSYRAGQTIAGAVTLDVGKGGLAIRTMNPFPPGTAIQVKFRLPGGDADIDAVGRVAWSDRKVGMGVQFDRISAADQDAVDAFVDGHR